MAFWNRFEYVTVDEKRRKAARSLQKLKKKNQDIRPVVVEGRTIAATWWGKAWNENLERYADYSNRIGRGRSYVRNGAVLDLQIRPGEVEALVQGRRSNPYKVMICIKELSKTGWSRIKKASQGQLDSLQELLSGKFPKALGEIFTERAKGLFPEPREIKFSCSCPDWASMCKHVAAVLYGISARLDEEPALFFILRNAAMRELVTEAVEGKTKELLKKAGRKSHRIMEKVDLSEIFGIDLEQDAVAGLSDPPSEWPQESAAAVAKPKRVKNRRSEPAALRRRGRPRKTPKPALREKVKAPELRLKPAKEKRPAKTAAVAVFDTIRKSRKGIGVAEICQKTGLEEQKVRNLIFRLRKTNRIKNIARGV
ncbi:MAG: hypothetical protein Q8P24_01695, partial [Desulfobacterales bacterium]|nr:hypothetical protein [Desulfobacterales bacterium]